MFPTFIEIQYPPIKHTFVLLSALLLLCFGTTCLSLTTFPFNNYFPIYYSTLPNHSQTPWIKLVVTYTEKKGSWTSLSLSLLSPLSHTQHTHSTSFLIHKIPFLKFHQHPSTSLLLFQLPTPVSFTRNSLSLSLSAAQKEDLFSNSQKFFLQIPSTSHFSPILHHLFSYTSCYLSLSLSSTNHRNQLGFLVKTTTQRNYGWTH